MESGRPNGLGPGWVPIGKASTVQVVSSFGNWEEVS